MHSPVDFNKLKPLSPGISAYVYGIDDDGGIVERQVFDHLDSHANTCIIGFLGDASSKSIVLERGQPLPITGERDGIFMKKKMSWMYMHEKGVIHTDFGCENMVLVQDRIKIIDFEGCSIDGKESSQSDIFAYGCMVYHIITGTVPNHELATSEDRTRIVRQLYSENKFPKVRSLPLGDLMQGCWYGSFESMNEVLEALDAATISADELGYL
ncbi:kinase-like domain-containing protein [Trichoderma ceciliae]